MAKNTIVTETTQVTPTGLNIIEEVLALQGQLAEKRQAAIEALLAEKLATETRHTSELQVTLDKLASLGWSAPSPVILQRNGAKPGASNGTLPTAIGPDRHCKICNAMGHDARMHRGQAVKAKFTPTELAALGVH